jgi:DNA-binding CsgD family transcriptional regulator
MATAQGCLIEETELGAATEPGAASLHALAGTMTPDHALQAMLVADMATHLVLMRTALPEQDPDFYLRSCAAHARTRLRRTQATRVVEMPRVAMNELPSTSSLPVRTAGESVDPAEPTRVLARVVSAGRTADLMPKLTARQQQVFTLLAVGTGIREAARQLGMSHVAVIKHRRKIARAAQGLLHAAD